MAKPPGQCIFCGNGGLSKEHVWSDWMQQLLPKHPNDTHARALIVSERHTPKIRRLEKFKNYQGNVSTIRLRVVCNERCNNGWMSRLDERVKPILTPLIVGEPFVLSQENQRLLATWITMKIMVAEHENPSNVATRQEQRNYLMNNLSPPEGWRIWIGQQEKKSWAVGYARHALTLGMLDATGKPVPPGKDYRKNTQSVTLGFGSLVVHTFASMVKQFDLAKPLLVHFKRIWPFEESFFWPGQNVISDSMIEQLSQALHEFSKTINWSSGPNGGSGT